MGISTMRSRGRNKVAPAPAMSHNLTQNPMIVEQIRKLEQDLEAMNLHQNNEWKKANSFLKSGRKNLAAQVLRTRKFGRSSKENRLRMLRELLSRQTQEERRIVENNLREIQAEQARVNRALARPLRTVPTNANVANELEKLEEN